MADIECADELIDSPEITSGDDGSASIHWRCCDRVVALWKKQGVFRIFPEEVRSIHRLAAGGG